MQITADVSKILKTVQRDLTFILNALSEYSINLPCISICRSCSVRVARLSLVLGVKNVVSFT